MAITQDRMIAVLDAANTLIRQYKELSDFVKLQAAIRAETAINKDYNMLAGLYAQLTIEINNFAPSIESITIIARETAHFNLRKKVNARAAQNLRNQRAAIATVVEVPSESMLFFDTDQGKSMLLRALQKKESEKVDPLLMSDAADIIKELSNESDVSTQIQIINKLKSQGMLLTGEFPSEIVLSTAAHTAANISREATE